MSLGHTIHRHRYSLAGVLVIAIIFLGLATSTAFAATPRVPQVTFNTAPLQGYLTSLGESVNVANGQLDIQSWGIGTTGNSDFTLMLKNGSGNEVGVYNGNDPLPNLYAVFPSGAVSGWSAHVHFGVSNLSVALFDENGAYQGQTNYAGVDKTNFAFYIKNGTAVYYSQDVRNVSGPQVLTYAGTSTLGDWWLCFEGALASPNSTYDDAVLSIQSVRPTPTSNSTWGNIKARYR